MSCFYKKATFGVFLNHPDAKMPIKANPSDAGFDVTCVETVVLAPSERKLVDTGLHLKMEAGWECQLRARSGNAIKLGLTLVNGIGTIDATYTGPIKAIVLNTSPVVIEIPKGSKIAQLVFQRIPTVELELLTEMPTNDERGSKGFGSSGLKA